MRTTSTASTTGAMPESSERFHRLLEVQDHDTAIDQLLHRRANLGQREELRTIEARIAVIGSDRNEVATERDVLGTRQSSLEEQIAASRTRSAEIDRRLYSGQVTAARDLQAMAEEVKHLARHVSELEDRELEVMEQLEPLDAALATMDGELAGLDAQAEELRRSIAEHEAEIESELARERGERDRLAAEVPADLLSRYEQLRTKLGGTGAARLVGGSCGGCHLQLPAMELDRVKKAPPDAVIYCDQCGRILVR
ncbi:MAG: zinc ribbon domain-containing protein [Acidimicrobiales bacterium]